MASLLRVNPVIDGNARPFFGHPVDYFEIDAGSNLALLTGPIDTPTGALAQIIQTIELQASIEILGQTGTLHLIGNGGAASSAGGAFRVAVSGPSAWPSNVALQQAIVANGNIGGANLALATVYSFTF